MPIVEQIRCANGGTLTTFADYIPRHRRQCGSNLCQGQMWCEERTIDYPFGMLVGITHIQHMSTMQHCLMQLIYRHHWQLHHASQFGIAYSQHMIPSQARNLGGGFGGGYCVGVYHNLGSCGNQGRQAHRQRFTLKGNIDGTGDISFGKQPRGTYVNHNCPLSTRSHDLLLTEPLGMLAIIPQWDGQFTTIGVAMDQNRFDGFAYIVTHPFIKRGVIRCLQSPVMPALKTNRAGHFATHGTPTTGRAPKMPRIDFGIIGQGHYFL